MVVVIDLDFAFAKMEECLGKPMPWESSLGINLYGVDCLEGVWLSNRGSLLHAVTPERSIDGDLKGGVNSIW